MPQATLNDIRKFFGYTSATAFAKDWRELTVEDQAQLKVGVGDGTFNY